MEELHKLRVALRRRRTLFWAYRPLLDEDFDNGQRAILKSLAAAAGNTRDWDILISLVKEHSDEQLLKAFEKNREDAAKKSRETLSNSNIEKLLRDLINEANQRAGKLRFGHSADCVRTEARESSAEVRKAGRNVRYLIEFFEPLLSKKQRKGLKNLKRLKKRFGSLNDVIASWDLLKRVLVQLARANRLECRTERLESQR